MSKKVKIPECANPFEVSVNGKKYRYPAGADMEVPDDVAPIIEAHNKKHEPVEHKHDAPFSGGASSWNDLSDKPFYEETTTVGGDTLTWDGNTEGLEKFGGDTGICYRVSDNCPSITDLSNGGSIAMAEGNTKIDVALADCSINDLGDGAFSIQYSSFVLVYVIPIDYDEAGIKKGIYLNGLVTSFTIHGYTGFETTTTVVKPIETKYLPEHLQFGETVAKGDTLTWDCNTEGLEVKKFEGMTITHAKVSDEFIPISAIAGGKVTFSMAGGGMQSETYEFAPERMMGESWCDGTGYVMVSDGSEEAVSVGMTKGVWLVCSPEAQAAGITMTLTIPGSNAFESKTVKPMDEKYMPILTSPSGKKFKLSVDDSGVISATEV